MWKLKVIVIFLNIFGIIKLTKYLHDRKKYMNELISPRTMGHLTEEKYQVTGNYLCVKYILGCLELHFSECVMVE